MQLNTQPLLFAAILSGFVAVVAGLLLAFRRLSGAATSPLSHLWPWYVAALLLYGGALYAGSQLNPRDLISGSWTDPFLRVATGLGFFTCVVLPLRLRLPLLGHVAVTGANLLVLAWAFWLWFSATA